MPATPRVLLLTEESGVGGVQTTLRLLSQALSERGWQVTRLPLRQGRPGLWACWQAARQAQVLVASNNFWPAYWAVLLGRLSARPSVVWVHGPLHEVLQQAGASRAKVRWLQTIYRLASQVVCASQTSLASFSRVMAQEGDGLLRWREAPKIVDALATSDGARLGPAVCVIRNPAVMPGTAAVQNAASTGSGPASDTQAFAPARAESPNPGGLAREGADAPGPIPLGFVGRLSSEKQPLQLIALLQHLPAAYQLHVVGDGECMGAMCHAGQTLIAQGRLHLHGQQAVHAQTYQAWRATVLCSLYEGYPMTALESLACGVPCVSTPIAAMQEMLGAHAPMCLARDASPAALAEAVQACLAQTPQASQAALQATLAAHGVRPFAQAWDQLLRRLARCEPGPGAAAVETSAPAPAPEGPA